MKAFEVAKHIIDYCIGIDNPISNLQLQKILYFVDIYYLINKNERLITDCNFSAWDYGPVIKEVYDKYSSWGPIPIVTWEDFEEDLPQDFKGYIYGYIDKLSKEYASVLVEESYRKDTPWDIVYNKEGNRYCEIPTYLMEQFAKKQEKSIY